MTNFQRVGSVSNTHVGREFESTASQVLKAQGLELTSGYKVPVGFTSRKKEHAFDLGASDPQILVECKSHTWTSGDNAPSAKLKNWSEAMLYFAVAPSGYRKIFFIARSVKRSSGESLGEYYRRTHYHLIPDDVEFWEYDPDTKAVDVLP